MATLRWLTLAFSLIMENCTFRVPRFNINSGEGSETSPEEWVDMKTISLYLSAAKFVK